MNFNYNAAMAVFFFGIGIILSAQLCGRISSGGNPLETMVIGIIAFVVFVSSAISAGIVFR